MPAFGFQGGIAVGALAVVAGLGGLVAWHESGKGAPAAPPAVAVSGGGEEHVRVDAGAPPVEKKIEESPAKPVEKAIDKPSPVVVIDPEMQKAVEPAPEVAAAKPAPQAAPQPTPAPAPAPATTAQATPAKPPIAHAPAAKPPQSGDDEDVARELEHLGEDQPASESRESATPLAAGTKAAPLASAGASLGERAKALLSAIPKSLLDAHVVVKGDNLGKIAKASQCTVGLIRRLNGLSGDTIRLGQTIAVPRGPFRVEVDRAAFTLIVYAGDAAIQQYTIGTGKDGSTPAGDFTVQTKVENPEWTSPDGEFFAPDNPQNPLGTRWIGVTEGYGIHGTTDPGSIGKNLSHGCVRMENWAVEEVSDFLGTGSKVTIR